MFSEHLKQARQKRKMTQQELAKKINKSRASIAGYESGDRTPDLGTLVELSQALGVDVNWLLGLPSVPGQDVFPDISKTELKERVENHNIYMEEDLGEISALLEYFDIEANTENVRQTLLFIYALKLGIDVI